LLIVDIVGADEMGIEFIESTYNSDCKNIKEDRECWRYEAGGKDPNEAAVENIYTSLTADSTPLDVICIKRESS
jgi:hypothetical protein